MSIESLKTASEETKKSVEKMIKDAGIETQRELGTAVQFEAKGGGSGSGSDSGMGGSSDNGSSSGTGSGSGSSDNSSNSGNDKLIIRIDPSSVNSGVDNTRVEAQDYSVTLPAKDFEKHVGDSAPVITITEKAGQSAWESTDFFANAIHSATLSGSAIFTQSVWNGLHKPAIPGRAKTVGTSRAYIVEFRKNKANVDKLSENIKLSLSVLKGESKYQAVFNQKGEVVGGKYNPVANTIDVKISKADTYIVKENKKDFSDVKDKSKEMQEAIRILASKGIISGVGADQFNPDGTMTRGDIAVILYRLFKKLW